MNSSQSLVNGVSSVDDMTSKVDGAAVDETADGDGIQAAAEPDPVDCSDDQESDQTSNHLNLC